MTQLVKELGGTGALNKTENYIDFSWSKYANVKNGFKEDEKS